MKKKWTQKPSSVFKILIDTNSQIEAVYVGNNKLCNYKC